MTTAKCRTVEIASDLGVHLRAAGALVRVAGQYEADIWIEHQGTRANAKSIMSVLSLAAAKGAELNVFAEGADAEQAVNAICELIANEFEVS